MSEPRSYYGSCDGELQTYYNVGLQMVDEAYQRILDKHEVKLVKLQNKIINDLKKTFKSDLTKMNNQFRILSNRLCAMEAKFKKEKEDASSKGKESKNT